MALGQWRSESGAEQWRSHSGPRTVALGQWRLDSGAQTVALGQRSSKVPPPPPPPLPPSIFVRASLSEGLAARLANIGSVSYYCVHILTGKAVMHDPFAMRPFFGYNFGDYIKHWLSLEASHANHAMPKIFHVNWFRKNEEGKFVWPGFGENIRVLEWILERIENYDVAEKTAIGLVPKEGCLNVTGLKPMNMDELFHAHSDFIMKECDEIEKYFKDQVNKDLPEEMWQELNNLRDRASKMNE